MKPFKVHGFINIIKQRIFHRGDECLGTCAVNGRRFNIRVSLKSAGEPDDFIDTLIHELMHLWLYILMAAYQFKLSEAAQHRIIEKAAPVTVKLLKREIRRKVRK